MKLRLIALAAVLGTLTFVAGASAAGGAGGGSTVTPYSTSFPGADCTGNRIEHSGSNTFIKDVETCITTIDFYAPGTYDVLDPTVLWCSDYELSIGDFDCNLATSGHLTVTYKRDGTVIWNIVAYYATH